MIGEYVDYLINEQGVKSVFGKPHDTPRMEMGHESGSLGSCNQWVQKKIFYLYCVSNLFLVFKYVTVNGTTGEGLSLSVQERKQLAEEWVTKGKDK